MPENPSEPVDGSQDEPDSERSNHRRTPRERRRSRKSGATDEPRADRGREPSGPSTLLAGASNLASAFGARLSTAVRAIVESDLTSLGDARTVAEDPTEQSVPSVDGNSPLGTSLREIVRTSVFLYGIVGLAVGVSGHVLIGLLLKDVASGGVVAGVLALVSVISITFLGTGIAGIYGLVIGDRSPRTRSIVTPAFTAGAAGYFVFALLAFSLVTLKVNGLAGSSLLNPVDVVVANVLLTLQSGLVCAGVAYAVDARSVTAGTNLGTVDG